MRRRATARLLSLWIALVESKNKATAPGKHPWPKTLPQQMSLARAVLSGLSEGHIEDVASQFHRAPREAIRERLQTLAALGQARELEDGRFAA